VRKSFAVVKQTWAESFGIMGKYRRVFYPFIGLAFLQILALYFLFLAPRPPISTVLAPIVRAFWGENFLHYPFNFILLPKLYNYAEIILSVIVGAAMTGMTVDLVRQAKKRIPPGLKAGLKNSFKRYLSLIGVWIVTFILVSVVFRVPQFIMSKYHIGATSSLFSQWNVSRLLLVVSVLVGLMIEALFVYAIPSIMLEQKRTWKAIARSFSLAKRNFLVTFIVVSVPMIFVILMGFVKRKIPMLIDKTFPEITLWIMIIGIIISMLANCWITTAATTMLIKERQKESQG